MNILVNCDFNKRIIIFTLDIVSANNVAIELMRPLLSSFYNELFHIRCRCHIVNLIVKEGLNLVQQPINKIKYSIMYMSNNSSRVVFFKGLCRAYNKRPRIFGSDEPYRWNLT